MEYDEKKVYNGIKTEKTTFRSYQNRKATTETFHSNKTSVDKKNNSSASVADSKEPSTIRRETKKSQTPPKPTASSQGKPSPIPPPRKPKEAQVRTEDPLINFEMDGGNSKPTRNEALKSSNSSEMDYMDTDRKQHPVKGISLGKSIDSTQLQSKSTAAQAGIQKRESNLRQSTEKAIQFKRNLDEMEKRDQVEYEAASQKHDNGLKVWAEDNGKKRNIRTLLSTMHTVLWQGAKWAPCSLADLIIPNKVKIKYQKALLVVHPDRNVNECHERRFIAKRLFEAINEAYSVFESTELNR